MIINKYSLTKEELNSLKKYTFMKSNFLLDVKETVEGKFCIRPICWMAGYNKYGKMVEGKYLASFDTRENAIDALIEICNYSRSMAIQLS